MARLIIQDHIDDLFIGVMCVSRNIYVCNSVIIAYILVGYTTCQKQHQKYYTYDVQAFMQKKSPKQPPDRMEIP